MTETELAWLIEQTASHGESLDIAFGAGGAAIQWPKGSPMPTSARLIGERRGVLNENTNGAGI